MNIIKSLYANHLSLLLILGISANTLMAQREEVRTVTENFLIKNATVIPVPGKELTGMDVLVEKGIIRKIGQDLPINGNTQIVRADSLFVYAGFIEGISHTGIPRQAEARVNNRGDENSSGSKVKDPGNPPNELAGIQPEIQTRDKLVPTDNSVAEMRKLGFVAAHTVPRGHMLPGAGAVIQLHGTSGDALILKDRISLFSQFAPIRGVYPATIIGVIAKWKDLYRQAEISQQYSDQYARSSLGLPRPERNKVLEAFYPVVDGEIPVFFKASSALEIQRALTLKRELGFTLVLADVKQAVPIVEKLREVEVGVLVSLDLPDEKKEKKKTPDKAPVKSAVADSASLATASVDSAKAVSEKADTLDPEVSALQARKKQAMKSYERQAAVLDSLGIPFGFSTLTIRPKDIRKALDRMIESGLPEDAALRGLTVSPAQMLGLDQVMGTVEEGKLGNLVITTRPYFDKDAQVAYVMVDGELFEYEIKEKGANEKTEDGDPIDITGIWDYSVKVPGESADGVLTVRKQNEALQGTMTNSQFDLSRPLDSIAVNGKTVTFKMKVDIEGEETELEYRIAVDGDYFEGEVSAGQFGIFPVEGKRIESPDN